MPVAVRKLLKLPNDGALPAGWRDIPAQVALFALAYGAYRVVQGLVTGESAVAFQNARGVISIERALHIFIEPSMQSWISHSHLLMALTSWLYLNAQFTITAGALAYLYFWRHESFRAVRNALMVAMAIALVGYLLLPTAPPRWLPEWHFVDTVTNVTGLTSGNSGLFASFVNPYAAVPSMHVAFAVIIALALGRGTRSPLVRALWIVYPLAITFVVLATGNHFVLDSVLGTATAAVSIYAGGRVSRAFAWRPPALGAASQIAGQAG